MVSSWRDLTYRPALSLHLQRALCPSLEVAMATGVERYFGFRFLFCACCGLLSKVYVMLVLPLRTVAETYCFCDLFSNGF